jgi:hypothetical protein
MIGEESQKGKLGLGFLEVEDVRKRISISGGGGGGGWW